MHAARQVPLVLCAALVTASATAAAVTASGAGVAYVVTGEDGNADEDLVCAERSGRLLRAITTEARRRRRPSGVARSGPASGRDRGREVGGERPDIEMCTQIDRFDFSVVAQEHDGVITATARR